MSADKTSASALRRQRRRRAAGLAASLSSHEDDSYDQGAHGSASLPQNSGGRQLPTVQGCSGALQPTRRHTSTATGAAASESDNLTRFEWLTASLEAGGEAKAVALQKLQGSVRRMSFDANGCRVVQQALQCADRAMAAILTAELHGHVRQAVGSPHANYVIQKVVEVMPTSLAGFVAEELLGSGALVARHRYGCRIVCRLLEHSAMDPGTVALTDEVLGEAADLCRHSFARHVLQSILEHGLPAQREKVSLALRSDLLRNARNRNASYVIERALTYCNPAERRVLASELLGEKEQGQSPQSPKSALRPSFHGNHSGIIALAQNQFGSYVVRALLRLPGETSRQALAQLQSAAPQLQRTKHGQRLLEELDRAGTAGLSTGVDRHSKSAGA